MTKCLTRYSATAALWAGFLSAPAAMADGRPSETVTVAAIQSTRLGAGAVVDGAVIMETTWSTSDVKLLDRKLTGLRLGSLPEGLPMARGQLTGVDGEDLGEIWCDTRLGNPSRGGYHTSCLRDADGDGELESLWSGRSAIAVGPTIGGDSLLGTVSPARLRAPFSSVTAKARMAIRLCVGDGQIGYQINFAVDEEPWFETPAFVDHRPCHMFMALGAGTATILGVPVVFERSPQGLTYRVAATVE